MTDAHPILLFGDDGSPASDVAWLWINAHRWTGWSLERITATTQVLPGQRPVREVDHPEREPFGESGFAAGTDALVPGDPRVILSDRADADLLVLGSHRERSGLRGAWLGSTAWWLMLRPAVPLLVAKHGARTRNVLLATDGSPHALAAARAFAALPWAGEAALHVAVVDDGHTDVEAAFAATDEALGAVPIAERHTLTGRPADAIAAAADAVSAELVVLGTRGLGPIKRWTVGSTATSLAYETDRNLLLACAAELDGDD